MYPTRPCVLSAGDAALSHDHGFGMRAASRSSALHPQGLSPPTQGLSCTLKRPPHCSTRLEASAWCCVWWEAQGATFFFSLSLSGREFSTMSQIPGPLQISLMWQTPDFLLGYFPPSGERMSSQDVWSIYTSCLLGLMNMIPSV